jgi:amino-acid N-acetyltransferase
VIGLEHYGDFGLLRSLAITQSYQKKGLGKVLVDTIIELAQEKKIKTIFLLTLTAAEFFSHLDFQIIERESVPDEIKNTAEYSSICPQSSIVMKKELDYA